MIRLCDEPGCGEEAKMICRASETPETLDRARPQYLCFGHYSALIQGPHACTKSFRIEDEHALAEV